MRIHSWLCLCLGAVSAGLGQTVAPALPELPKDPRDVFAMAAPFYDYNAADLKPWHLRASYQLYDDKGDATEQGVYEYWWVSPQVNRSTWRRPGATHTDWHTANGQHAHEETGEGLNFFEYKVQSALLSPLPSADELDPAKFRLDRQTVTVGGAKFPCIMVVPHMPQHGQAQIVPLGMFPTYCFDPHIPVLRISYSLGTVTMEFNKVVKAQNHYLAKEIQFLEGNRRILTATVDRITELSPADAALTPSAEARVAKTDRVALSAGVTVGMLVKKQIPAYPQDAKDARVSGTVVLQAIIGRDGRIHDLRVVSAPWPSLAGSALWSVSHWEYKPYLFNGEPVEVETTVNVVYALGN